MAYFQDAQGRKISLNKMVLKLSGTDTLIVVINNSGAGIDMPTNCWLNY